MKWIIIIILLISFIGIFQISNATHENICTPIIHNETNITNQTIPNDGYKIFLFSDVQIYSNDTKDKFWRMVNWTLGDGGTSTWNNTYQNISYGFCVGDQIDDANKPEQFNNFSFINSHLNFSRECVAGNHDHKNPTICANQTWCENNNKLIKINNTCFALFDSTNGQTNGGWNQQQINWINQTMKSNIGNCQFFVTLSHHPIFSLQYNFSPNGTKMAQVMELWQQNYSYVGSVNGHLEYFKNITINNIEYTTLPAVRQMTTVGNNALGMTFNANTGLMQLCYYNPNKGCVDV